MKALRNYSFIYAIGSVGYGLLETLWRGYTHWSMVLTGGTCFVLMYRMNLRLAGQRLWKRCLLGSIMITSLEWLVGCIVNLKMNWNVWDYSGLPFNIKGQICPLFSLLWFLLSIPVLKAADCLHLWFLKLPQKTTPVALRRSREKVPQAQL